MCAVADLPALIAKCERVLEGVTPGPWEVRPDGMTVRGPDPDNGIDRGKRICILGFASVHGEEYVNNLDFIAAARTLLPALVAALRTPPSEEEWTGLERAHGSGCHLTFDDGNCACGADSHNARLSALRAKVEAERERTRRVVEAAQRWETAKVVAEKNPAAMLSSAMTTGEAAAVMDAYSEAEDELLRAVRALRGEP